MTDLRTRWDRAKWNVKDDPTHPAKTLGWMVPIGLAVVIWASCQPEDPPCEPAGSFECAREDDYSGTPGWPP